MIHPIDISSFPIQLYLDSWTFHSPYYKNYLSDYYFSIWVAIMFVIFPIKTALSTVFKQKNTALDP